MTKIATEDLLKTKESFLVIEFDYSNKFVMKHAQGIKLLDAMNGMELYKNPYNDTATIEHVAGSEYPKSYLISQERYLELKMNALLKVDTSTSV